MLSTSLSLYILVLSSKAKLSALFGAAQSGSVEIFDWLVSRFSLPPDEVNAVSVLKLVVLCHIYRGTYSRETVNVTYMLLLRSMTDMEN